MLCVKWARWVAGVFWRGQWNGQQQKRRSLCELKAHFCTLGTILFSELAWSYPTKIMLLEGLYCLRHLAFGYSLNSEGKQIKRCQGDWVPVLVGWWFLVLSLLVLSPSKWVTCMHFNVQYQLPLLALSLEVNMEDLETLGQRITNY